MIDTASTRQDIKPPDQAKMGWERERQTRPNTGKIPVNSTTREQNRQIREIRLQLKHEFSVFLDTRLTVKS